MQASVDPEQDLDRDLSPMPQVTEHDDQPVQDDQ